VGIQYTVLARVVHSNRVSRGSYEAVAARLHRAGVRPPCVLSGSGAVPVAYYTGCASRETGGPDGSITPAALVARARTEPVAVLVPARQPPPAYARAWHPVPLPGSLALSGYRAYVAVPGSGEG
jgi:hypothetical protein